ncbi:MAG: TlpA family protein disulfide reductase [Candidatus Firestonebacteria bacterium]|nr:TlpA family protein disulfide reductase [Candidatus Firestonebacteria bacterium]
MKLQTKIIIFISLLLYCIPACGDNKNSNTKTNSLHSAKNNKKAYQKAPDFTLKNMSNESVTLSNLNSKIIIINFWATWCPYCIMEMPDFVSLYNTYKNNGVAILGIALDDEESVQSFLKKNKINYPILMGTNDVRQAYGGIRGLPTTFVLNNKKEIVASFEGKVDKAVIENEIKKLL